MMGMRLGSYLRQEQRYYLSHAQILGLKQLLSIQQTLKDPVDRISNIQHGLEGMKVAHQILQSYEASGLLIGGLAEAVWNQQRTEEDLYKHKDVDVLVWDTIHSAIDTDGGMLQFEGGIDWWIPQKGKITLPSISGSSNSIDKQWYVNGNGVVLSFGAQKKYQLPPGLYIPDSEWVIDMRAAEAEAHVDYGRVDVEFDEDVFEKFRVHMRERVKTILPKFVRDAFTGYILSPQYETDRNKTYAVGLEKFDVKTVSGINELETIVKE